jgi:hypothetical protein
VAAISNWGSHHFGDLDPRGAIRVVLPSATAIATGVLVIFSGFLASLLTLRGVARLTNSSDVPPHAADQRSATRSDHDALV